MVTWFHTMESRPKIKVGLAETDDMEAWASSKELGCSSTSFSHLLDDLSLPGSNRSALVTPTPSFVGKS